MTDRIMILSSDVHVSKNEREADFVDMMYGCISEGVYIPKLYQWFDYEKFVSEIEDVQKQLKRSKNKLVGKLVCAYLTAGTNELKHVIVRILTKKVDTRDVEISISIRSGNDRQKQLTNEQKMVLFHEYWEENHAFPPAGEVYKDFAIGRYFQTLMKNKDTIRKVEESIDAELSTDNQIDPFE